MFVPTFEMKCNSRAGPRRDDVMSGSRPLEQRSPRSLRVHVPSARQSGSRSWQSDDSEATRVALDLVLFRRV